MGMLSGTDHVSIQFFKMLLETYDVAAGQFPFCPRSLFSVTTAASTYQVRWVVGL